jgi:hypothetical protein
LRGFGGVLCQIQENSHAQRFSHHFPILGRISIGKVFQLKRIPMKYHKLKAGETTGTYVMEPPVTEADILQMAQQLAMSRLSKGRALTEPKQVFDHLQTLLQYHEHEVFALLLLDTRHRVIGFRELIPRNPGWWQCVPTGSGQDRSRT